MSSIPVSGLNTPHQESTRSAGLLVNKFGLIGAAILLIIFAWAGQTIIVILLGLVIGVAGLSRLWSYLSLKGVTCQRQLSETRVFPDEYLELKLKLTNRKLLPLPWIEINDQVPSGFVEGLSSTDGNRPGFDRICQSSSILWYSAISWKYRLQCKKRGYYPLGPLTVTSGDIFGFYPRTANQSNLDFIIVYPRIYGISHLAIPSVYPLGDVKSDKRIFEDPSRTIGIRDYVPGDSLRRIHWKASARQQQLQVKIFEPTTTLRVALFLAVDSFRDVGTWRLDDLELGISTAASLASYLANKNSQVGLWANTKLADSGQPARITPGSGVDRLIEILEALAKVVPASDSSFLDFFQNERRTLPLGLTLIFVVAEISDEMKHTLIDLKESGYKILVFQIGGTSTGQNLPDIAWYPVAQPADLERLV
jgi:uncharacterized protein (DUF58 family)